MFDVGESLRAAFDDARAAVGGSQRAIALANAGRQTGRSADGALAQSAEAAIFTEALIAAEHARLAEIKAVAK